jgi:hypothetical protein
MDGDGVGAAAVGRSPPSCDLAVRVVTDRSAWADKALRLLDGPGVVVEQTTWSAGSGLEDVPAAMVFDITCPFQAKRRLCGELAERAWQPVAVCCLAAEPGAARVSGYLRRIGYSVVELLPAEDAHWEDLQAQVSRILEGCAWIAPRFARALDCYDRQVVDAYVGALDILPGRASVELWADRLAMRRQDLAAMFAEMGLPTPKTMLDWLWLVRLIEFAQAAGQKMKRKDLAGQFGSPSPDYVGRRARELTGVPLGKLLAAGSQRALEIMAVRVGGPRRRMGRRQRRVGG